MKLLLAMAVVAAPLMAQCTYSVTPSTFNVPASTSSPNTGVVTVTAPDGCAWQPTVSSASANWLSVYTVQPGPGSGQFGFAAAQNPTNVARTGSITVAGATVTVNQAAAVCAYTVSPATMNFPVGGGNGTVQVGANCVWTTGVSDGSWIIVPSTTTGTFAGSFNYSIGANPCLGSRSGALGVGFPGTTSGAVLQITEDGSPSNLTLSPAAATIGPAATDGTLNVAIGPNCPWSAFTDASWLQITSANAAYGNFALLYHAAANPSSARTGHIQVGPQIFTLTQQVAAAPAIQVNAVTNAASGVQGPVSPGEIVSLYGANMGPATGVPLQVAANGTSIATSLGGVQVTFDGTAAALTYASATQINAVVPYGLIGGNNTDVRVQYQGGVSNTVTLVIQNASPGIFTLDASGVGPGAILNQDFTVNANANRAARGSIVAIYLTGGGNTNPASVDASITPTTLPLPQLIQPVSVLIGGSVAQVQYAGAAPGGIAGFTQINVTVPAGVTPGPAVPVVIGIGAYVSQPGVTLAVK